MCRQIVLNKQGAKLIEEQYGGLENYLNFLVIERGGNGNGIVLFKNGKIIRYKKGVHFPTIKTIARELLNDDYEWALFHTRLASIGEISDQNCHPFVFSDNFVFAMNGTESEYLLSHPSKDMESYTDTYIIGRDLYKSKKHPKEFFEDDKFHSVFMGFFQGKPFVDSHNNNAIRVLTTGNIHNLSENDPIIFASDFPCRYDGRNIYDFIEDRFYWEAGMPLPTDIMTKAPTGKLCLIDGVGRQLYKICDTELTIVSQQSGVSEEELSHLPLSRIFALYELYNQVLKAPKGKVKIKKLV